jgi:hypothetical protein
MKVSFSEVYAWQTCQQQFFYKHSLKLQPISTSSALKTGIDGHTLLKTFYTAIQDGHSKKEALSKVTDLFNGKLTPETVIAFGLVENYIADLDLKGKAVIVDRPNYVEFPHLGITVAFTPDLLWHYASKRLDLEDYKFVGRLWSKPQLARYVQLDLYNALLRILGYRIGSSKLRFFNTTTKKVSHKTYDPTQTRLDNIMKEFLAIALKIAEYKSLSLDEQKEQTVRTFNYTTCRWCKFTFPCDLELDGKDATKTLLNEYVSSDYGYDNSE